MKKLNLKKQKITSLSNKEMNNVNGGGRRWSNFRGGNCGYSESHGKTVTNCETGEQHIVGCYRKA